MSNTARDRAKGRRRAQRVASGERPPSPAQIVLLEGIADPEVHVGCARDPQRPGRRVSWLYRRTGAVRRQNVTLLCDEMEFAGLIELDDPGAPLTSEDRTWRLTSAGRALLDARRSDEG